MITVNQTEHLFHLHNGRISYLLYIMESGQLGHLYFGKALNPNGSYRHMIEKSHRPMTTYFTEGDLYTSYEHLCQEYPCYGTSDYRYPALEIQGIDGSRICKLEYQNYCIIKGKKPLPGLPATYTEEKNEADTLEIIMKDPYRNLEVTFSYTIFYDFDVITRSVRFFNYGNEPIFLNRAMSMSIDMPDSHYQSLQLSGSWSRERYIKIRDLEPGITSISSTRGHSSHQHNPFLALKRSSTTEQHGEVYGFSLIYSGNFLAQIEVDNYQILRIMLGINPFGFQWKLKPKTDFFTPEAVMVYSENGLNGMSTQFHRLYRKRLARGYWRDRERPVLLNSWEAVQFDYTEDTLLQFAKKAKDCGIELFVLDDGWFSTRNDDKKGLGDWIANPAKLPNGIEGLAEKLEELGIKFGLWFEPEMVNKDSDFFRSHPDFLIQTPGRSLSHGRNQYVLDFSRPEVVDAIYKQMDSLLSKAKISYIKWDMNRSISECYSAAYPPDQQGEIFHRYILGVYKLHERLIQAFPKLLIESCASGGGRFDAGMIYYSPQGWVSDNSDAIERLKIQYGTSLVYPFSCMGAHVSACPNEQVGRRTPIETRGAVAYTGAFGYELDLNQLNEQEIETVKQQIVFYKNNRNLIATGDFYRLLSPFEENFAAWEIVQPNGKYALVTVTRILSESNGPYRRLPLCGLLKEQEYSIQSKYLSYCAYGDELMQYGLILEDKSSGQIIDGSGGCQDFFSIIYIIRAK
ncbi:MAG: alpha-galactosidase [Lachnospiraceae bacterium]|nr:alpha-galactosidase [Lachnospiraceae bacterium]